VLWGKKTVSWVGRRRRLETARARTGPKSGRQSGTGEEGKRVAFVAASKYYSSHYCKSCIAYRPPSNHENVYYRVLYIAQMASIYNVPQMFQEDPDIRKKYGREQHRSQQLVFGFAPMTLLSSPLTTPPPPCPCPPPPWLPRTGAWRPPRYRRCACSCGRTTRFGRPGSTRRSCRGTRT
jgi:hypothetical protein